jgi:proteasome lid subunit RPN8/RPN11
MRLFRSSGVIGIAAAALDFVIKASEDAHPDEYMGFLRGEDARALGLEQDGTVLTDILVIPGTETNPVSATVDTNMIPNDSSAAGSVHSHPNGVLQPSDADLATFGRGQVHLIIGYPYTRDSWQAFDRNGQPTELPIVEVPMNQESFFDFTQADIDAELTQADQEGGE